MEIFDNAFQSILNQLFGTGLTNNCLKSLNLAYSILYAADHGGTNGHLTTIRQLYGILETIGLAFIVVMLFVTLATLAINSQVTAESMIRTFAQAIAAVLIMDNGIGICNLIFRFASSVTKLLMSAEGKITATPTEYSYAVSAMTAFAENAHLLTQIGIFFKLLFPLILSWVAEIVVRLTCLTMVLELTARVILAPLAIADNFSNSRFFHIHAVTYFKKLLGVCLQGACILLIVFMFQFVSTAVMANDPNLLSTKTIVSEKSDADADGAKTAVETTKILEISSLANENKGKDGDSKSSTDDALNNVKYGKSALKNYADDGKKYYEKMFTSASVVSLCALEVTMILAVTKSRDLAYMLVGVDR